MGNKGGILTMVLSVLGIILFVSLFVTIVTAINSLRYGATALTPYTAFDTILSIAPTVLFLTGLFAAGFAYYKGYSAVAGGDASGFLRMVMGILEIVLFVTMFSTVLTQMETLRTTTNVANYTALSTVIGIAPTVLFLGGIFTGAFTAYKGARARGKKKSGVF